MSRVRLTAQVVKIITLAGVGLIFCDLAGVGSDVVSTYVITLVLTFTFALLRANFLYRQEALAAAEEPASWPGVKEVKIVKRELNNPFFCATCHREIGGVV